MCMCVSCSVVSDSLWPHGLWPNSSSVCGISQARILQWVAIPFSRGSSRPRDWTLPHCRQILYHLRHQGNPLSPQPGTCWLALGLDLDLQGLPPLEEVMKTSCVQKQALPLILAGLCLSYRWTLLWSIDFFFIIFPRKSLPLKRPTKGVSDLLFWL